MTPRAPATQDSPPNMKIVFVINAPIIGGAEKHTFALAAGLAARGADVGVFAIKDGDLPAPETVALDRPRGGGGGKYLRPLTRALDLARLIRRENPDIVVGVNGRPLLIASIARALSLRSGAVVTIAHTSSFRTLREKFWERLYRPLYRRAKAVIFISQNQRHLWLERGVRPREQTVILNGIDMTRYALAIRERTREAMRRELGFSDEDFVIGCCSMLRPEKNHLQLIEALARARARNMPAKALIVGEGEMRAAIVEAAEKAGVAAHVTLTGAQGDVRPYLAAMDLGVLCSTAIETLSLAALETLALGVPMLMSDLGGASEIVDGEIGAIFAVRNTDQLVLSIEQFYGKTRDRNFALFIREHVEKKFAEDQMNKQYFDFFEYIRAGRS